MGDDENDDEVGFAAKTSRVFGNVRAPKCLGQGSACGGGMAMLRARNLRLCLGDVWWKAGRIGEKRSGQKWRVERKGNLPVGTEIGWDRFDVRGLAKVASRFKPQATNARS
jgi:hypothetical protein